MKTKFFIFIMAFFVILSSCKDDITYGDVSFEVINNSNISQSVGIQKAKSSIPICSDLRSDYVVYSLNGGNFDTIPIFYIGQTPYTNTIKLPVGNYYLTEFLVYNNNNTPNDFSDDILISATPHEDSEFSSYITNPLDIEFSVDVDKKSPLTIETVCYNETYFDLFGFKYFKLNQIKVRELWFYSDFCIKHKSDYQLSLYANQINWNIDNSEYIDVPAIIKIEVYHNNILQNTFTNTYEGEKLNVKYPDYQGVVDNYELKLYIYVKVGDGFEYKYFKSFYFNDASDIDDGGDGVIDGVLGSCYDPNNLPDFILSPYMNLPKSLVYKIVTIPSSYGGYVDAQLSNIGVGYDITNGTYPSFCADHTKTINIGQSYNMDLYSSLYQDNMPNFAKSNKWNKLNWLLNHLDYYTSYHWYDIQQVFWLYDNPIWDGSSLSYVPNITALAIKMKLDCDSYGSTYMPPPGGYACVILVPVGTLSNATNPIIQTMILKIDP